MSRLVNDGLVGLVAFVAVDCAHTLGEIPLADGNILLIEGYGTKSSVQLSCLGPGAVEQLIGTQIPGNVAKQTCYQVAVASSNSSDISKAVSAFVSADTEFGKMLQTGNPPSKDDKSLLKLVPAVAPSTLPVELASEATALPDGSTVTVIGWGNTSEGGKSSLQLQEADVKVINAATCKAQYRGDDSILDSMLCAANDREDSCQGDSGGPLLYARGGKKVQVGVVSFGKGCGRPGHSGVYTRISSFRK